MGQCVKPFSDGRAANDEFQSANKGLQRGELVRDLLRQRVKVPDLPSDFMARPHLNAQLAEAIRAATTVFIEAPSGFGKSCSILSAMKSRESGSDVLRWISLTNQENAPVRFLTLLSMALELPEELESALQGGASFSDALAMLLVAWSRQARPDLQVLVLDSFQALTNPAATALVHQLCRDLPKSLCLFVASRCHLPFETHQLELENRFVRIGSESLEFSRSETFEFFRQSPDGGGLTSVAIDRLYDLTEGWPTPLALYRRELQRGPDRKPLQECASVERFLKDTVLGQLTPAQNRSIRAVAELELCSDDLFFILQERLAEATMLPSEMCERGIPVRPMPGRGRWYRLNPLLQEWLQTQAMAGYSERMVLASRWFSRQQQFPEALRYALLAGDGDEVIRIASESSEALLLGQDTASLLRLRKSLPPRLLEHSGRLRIVYSWVHAIGGQFRQARALIDGLAGEERSQHAARLAALQAFILRGEGKVLPALDFADQALADETLSPQGQLVTQMVRSSALCAAGRFQEARDANRAASRLAREAGDSGSEALAVYSHARIELGKGALRHAEQLLRTGLDTAIQELARPARIGETRLQLNLVLVLWHQGRFDEADRLLVLCGRHAEQTRDLGLLLAMAIRVLICRAQQRLDDAFVWIGRAERTMHSWQVDESLFVPVLEALKASCWLAQGQPDSAFHALQRLQPYRDAGCVPELFPMMPGLLDCLEVRIHLSRGDLVRARETLLKTARQYQERIPWGVELHVKLLDAVLLHDEKGLAAARKALVAAVEEATPEHFISPFAELRGELQGLMEKCSDQLPDSRFKQSLAELFGLRSEDGNADTLQEPISEREQGVLELIAQGLSNQEIADKLHISLHTVKTHARRINAKLEVRSRTQAIVRARELGLL
ncbi:LuxR C-terminal-related transcriptional regulator [Marinobacter santoriniensis]|uniref:LuxR C-terminal-related transcriptional regulator n=1 Tax=Marinobacter santoriniensis TaxID=523742 RepID=UPI00034B5190